MTRHAMDVAAPVLRGLAILIAVAGVIDPSVTASRRQKPTVSVVTSDTPADLDLANQVIRSLEEKFSVVRGPFTGASAAVVVGTRLPASADLLPAPGFAVTPASSAAAVAIETVSAPASAQYQARVPIGVTTRVARARGRSLEVTLEHAGVTVDRVTRKIESEDAWIQTPLTFVPTAPGAVDVRVRAAIEGGGPGISATVAVEVREQRWTILVYDGRPSWTSTFVRRALESDPRFAITSRVITSRNVSVDSGQPPRAFDASSLDVYDAVVVGAPETLTDREVSGLDAYLRRRGGAVILLLDQRVPGSYDRLLQVDEWGNAATAKPATLEMTGPENIGRLQASELAWPLRLPAGARAMAESAASSARRAVVWGAPVGAGRVVVNGALDAWRSRSASSGFDRFWRTAIAEAASASPAPLDLRLDSAVLAPGDSTTARVTVREAALADAIEGRPIGATVTASIDDPSGQRESVRLWPDGPIGQFSGVIRAPAQPGRYRVAVSSGGSRAEAAIVVAQGVTTAALSELDLLDAWAHSRDGQSFPVDRLGELAVALDSKVKPETRRGVWHLMRSPLWIVPFVTLLGSEWWWRRRAGLA